MGNANPVVSKIRAARNGGNGAEVASLHYGVIHCTDGDGLHLIPIVAGKSQWCDRLNLTICDQADVDTSVRLAVEHHLIGIGVTAF